MRCRYTKTFNDNIAWGKHALYNESCMTACQYYTYTLHVFEISTIEHRTWNKIQNIQNYNITYFKPKFGLCEIKKSVWNPYWWSETHITKHIQSPCKMYIKIRHASLANMIKTTINFTLSNENLCLDFEIRHIPFKMLHPWIPPNPET